MKKNITKNMLIRDIPVDQWELVDSFCRRRKMKRRQFIALALSQLGGQETGEGVSAEASKLAARAAAEIQSVATQMQGFKNIIILKKEMDKLYNGVKSLRDPQTEMNMILELNRLQQSLNLLITKYVPRHDIPDDPEARRKMGLPEEYVSERVDIPADYKRKLDFKPVTDGDDAQTKPAGSEDPVPPESEGNHSQDVQGEAQREKRVTPLERVENFPTGNTKAKTKIKTTTFGRGFEKILDKD
jgi:hypothetical protein